jgi:hypothetical protein
MVLTENSEEGEKNIDFVISQLAVMTAFLNSSLVDCEKNSIRFSSDCRDSRIFSTVNSIFPFIFNFLTHTGFRPPSVVKIITFLRFYVNLIQIQIYYIVLVI